MFAKTKGGKKMSKRMNEAAKLVETGKLYDAKEAMELLGLKNNTFYNLIKNSQND